MLSYQGYREKHLYLDKKISRKCGTINIILKDKKSALENYCSLINRLSNKENSGNKFIKALF